MDVSLQMLGESGRCDVGIGADLLVVGHTEGNYVVVRCQNAVAADGAGTGVGLPAQHGLDFLRDDGAAEDPGEGVTDGRLEFALDTVDQTHITARLISWLSVVSAHVSTPARVSPDSFLG